MKTILAYVLVILLLVIFSSTTLATDLPIDIDAIGRQNEERQDALTVLWGVDLFSETSDARVKARVARQEREFEAAKELLFQDVQILTTTDPHEALYAAATENNMLFATPIRVRTITVVEEDQGISLWITVPVIIICAGLGLLIALRAKAKRKERS
ncbi:MAG: hypothetical protein FWD05_05860 [Oscillospiraceae bacterium]|nr:hypothetical protein [Oscillospiraceae bacterium]